MTRVTVYNCQVTTQTTRAINRCSGETPRTLAIQKTGSRQGRSFLARMDGFPVPGSARRALLSVINNQVSIRNTILNTFVNYRRKHLGLGEWEVSCDAGQGPGEWDRGHPEAWQRQDRVKRGSRTGRGRSTQVKIKNVHLPPRSIYDRSLDLLSQSGNHYGQVRIQYSEGFWKTKTYFINRYFKQTWTSKRCFNLDQWFIWHRNFMVLTWALTVAGFILIILELKGLSETISSNPHAIIGFVTVGLCFIQPFLALVRCSPNHHLRPLFNWVHWFIGTL